MQGLHLQSLIKEMETENEVLTNKVKELQHAENVRTIRREALQRELVADEEKMELEKENKRLKEEIKLEQLSGQKRQQQKHNLERDAQELQHILEKVEEDIRRKDEEIKQKSMTLNERCRGNENSYKTMKEQQELKQQLSIEADKRTAQRTSTMLPLGPLTLLLFACPVDWCKGSRIHFPLCPPSCGHHVVLGG
ncbi:inner centromere protein-like isoform X3 [Eleginops maclovinus]|uniref:inner centromere protein-like isoform X3 n=1 Tax=Eleginops maclovinus TaxID=56733 RepID=UPI00308087EB